MKSRNKISFGIALIFAIFLVMPYISASQVCVVVGKGSGNKADAGTLKNMFLGVKANWPGGAKVKIIDQSESPTGKIFYSKFLGESVSSVRASWTKLILSGQASAPIKCSSDDDVKREVNKDANAVGYIKESDVDASVKVIHKID